MAPHSLYPGFWKLYYTSNGHQHIMTVPVYPVDVGGVWLHKDKNGSTVASLTVAATAFVAAIKGLFHTTANFDYVELWTKVDENADPVFREAVNLNIAGTGATAAIAYGMMVLSFRTVDGGIYRCYLMEMTQAANWYGKAPFNATYLAIESALCGSTSYVCARDNSYLSSLASVATKTSDALRKKFILNVS